MSRRREFNPDGPVASSLGRIGGGGGVQLYPGLNAALRWQGGRMGIAAKHTVAGEWDHPWTVEMVFEAAGTGSADPTPSGVAAVGEWHAYFVGYGFLNGAEAYIPMSAAWAGPNAGPGVTAGQSDVGVTDDPAPYLVLKEWRDPLSNNTEYPVFFKSLNVRTPDNPTGDPNAPQPGARELRAADLVLAKARLATSLDIQLTDPFGDATLVEINPTYTLQEVARTGGRARLRATSRFLGAPDQSVVTGLGLALVAGDSGLDELLVATVWMVSPPEAGREAQVDETWEWYVEQIPEVCWNLGHAIKNVPAVFVNPPPVTVHTGLALGLGDRLNDLILAETVNDPTNEVAAYFNQAETRGVFWTI